MTPPWEIHPDLSRGRLILVAGLIRDIRHDALHSYFDPDKGDGSWGLGCVSYERTKAAIRTAAATSDWLLILAERPHFVFTVGAVPLRFYRGDVDDPSPRWLRRTYPEITCHQLAFPLMQDGLEWFWRLVVETDDTGEVVRVLYAQMTEHCDVRNVWEAPLGDTGTFLTAVSGTRREPVDLDPPNIGPKIDKGKRRQEEQDEE